MTGRATTPKEGDKETETGPRWAARSTEDDKSGGDVECTNDDDKDGYEDEGNDGDDEYGKYKN